MCECLWKVIISYSRFDDIKCCAYPVEGEEISKTKKLKLKNKTLVLHFDLNKCLIPANYHAVNEPRGEYTLVVHEDAEKIALACHVIVNIYDRNDHMKNEK